MQRAIDNMILSVSEKIKEFASGGISIDEARIAFTDLSGAYNSLVNRTKKSGDGRSQIEGLCYYHNIENYSLLTGIYVIDQDEIQHIASYGDDSLNTRTMKAIMNIAIGIDGSKLLQIPADGSEEFLHNTYLYPVNDSKTTKIIFAAVSSSNFFSEDKFLFIGKLIKNIFSVATEETRPIENNYFTKISDEVEKYLKENINDRHSVQVVLYVFSMIEKIFNHTGMDSLLEASDIIYNTLRDANRYRAKCFALSIRDYIVVKKINKKDSGKKEKKKAEFFYKNINLPYQTLKISVDKNESIHSLWDKIMTFENYLYTGDITTR